MLHEVWGAGKNDKSFFQIMKVIFKPGEMDGKIPISSSGSLIKPRFPNSVKHHLHE